MRHSAIALSVFGLFACNAILGNEDHYVLVGPSGGGDGGSTAGSGNVAGDSAAGEGGVAGAGDEAGSSGASVADSGESSGGAAGEAGSGASGNGAGGSSPCVATGPEDCFNGKDDDCNGAIDCADPACTPTSTCVPDATNADLGTLLLTGSSCPTGYSPVTLHRGLMVEPMCTGCSCGVGTASCNTSIVGHGSYACPGFQTSGLSYNMYTTSCQPIAPGTSTHHYAVLTFTDCTGVASGTAKPSTVQWSETSTFCKADRVGRGCKSGSSCVPKAPSAACSRKTGTASCTGAYAMSTGAVWNGGVNDTRSCGACECGGGYGECSNTSIQVYNAAGCTGTVANLSGAEGDDCALSFAPVSGRVTGTPVLKACVANVFPGGMIEEADPSTVCCQ